MCMAQEALGEIRIKLFELLTQHKIRVSVLIRTPGDGEDTAHERPRLIRPTAAFLRIRGVALEHGADTFGSCLYLIKDLLSAAILMKSERHGKHLKYRRRNVGRFTTRSTVAWAGQTRQPLGTGKLRGGLAIEVDECVDCGVRGSHELFYVYSFDEEKGPPYN